MIIIPIMSLFDVQNREIDINNPLHALLTAFPYKEFAGVWDAKELNGNPNLNAKLLKYFEIPFLPEYYSSNLNLTWADICTYGTANSKWHGTAICRHGDMSTQQFQDGTFIKRSRFISD